MVNFKSNLYPVLFGAFTLIFTACGDTFGDKELNEDTTQPTTKPTPVTRHIPTGVHINEILASNINTKMDSDYYKFSDWIEIYNNADTAIDISGYYLSDKKDNLQLWKIPSQTVLPAQGRILVWADGKKTKQKELHTNFKLSAKKEHLFFSDASGQVIDDISFKKQVADISCAPSGKDIVYMAPSPALADSATFSSNGQSAIPSFSQKGGFFDHAISVAFPADNGAVHYTTDGSIPTLKSARYTQPIIIDHNTVIKAIAKKGDDFPSAISTESYFINEASTLPVVSLSINHDYLYDDTVGIYGNGTNGTTMITPCRGSGVDNNKPYNFFQPWKRPAHINYFDASKKEAFSFDADLAIAGQCSRHYPKKSFKMQLDSKYGTKSVTYKLYDDKKEMKIKDFKIRPGNKGYEIGDVLATALSTNLHVDYQAYKAVRVFINGEYWGLYNLRERKGSDYIKSNYPNVDDKKLDIIKNSAKGGSTPGLTQDLIKEGNIEAYKHLEEVANKNGQNNYAEFEKLVDIDNLMDYLIVMIYSGNEDWSYSNSRAWREQKEGAKWRWMLDDLDEGFQEYVLNENLLGGYGVLNTNHEFHAFLQNILNNPAAKEKFINRFNELLTSNLSPANVKTQIDKILQQREATLLIEDKGELGKKWFGELNADGNIYSDLAGSYRDHKRRLHDFAEKRTGIVKGQLQKAIESNWAPTSGGDGGAGGSVVVIQPSEVSLNKLK